MKGKDGTQEQRKRNDGGKEAMTEKVKQSVKLNINDKERKEEKKDTMNMKK